MSDFILDKTGQEINEALNKIDTLVSYTPSIFDIKWSDHILNDMSWVRSDTFAWQDGNVYKTAYDTLVEEYASGVEETEDNITFKRSANNYKIATADMESAILNKYNTDGIAWYYILDTANKQFKLPRTKFGFEGLRDNVGSDIAESLPNITAYIQSNDWSISNANVYTGGNAVISESDNKFRPAGHSTGSAISKFGVDASKSSSTYQNNAPVQERATQMYLYFYVGEFSKTAIEQTAGINVETLNKKLDADFSNLTSDNMDYICSLGAPSNRYIDLNIGASGTSYTVPANGYVSYAGNFSVSGRVHLSCNNVQDSRYSHAGEWNAATIPVKKGDSFAFYYKGTANLSIFRFIYAEGSKE